MENSINYIVVFIFFKNYMESKHIIMKKLIIIKGSIKIELDLDISYQSVESLLKLIL